MVAPALFSSATEEWSTPQAEFDRWNSTYNFQLDAAANASNTKCPVYYDQSNSGLDNPWTTWTWCNPPYGRGVTGLWVRKAWIEKERGNGSVLLLPARTDTRWFDICFESASEIIFLAGRLKFGGSRASAPFPSMVVVFDPNALQGNPRMGRRAR